MGVLEMRDTGAGGGGVSDNYRTRFRFKSRYNIENHCSSLDD